MAPQISRAQWEANRRQQAAPARTINPATPSPTINPAAPAPAPGPLLPGETRYGIDPLPMEQNPAPDCRCPSDWVISEATALRMLTRFYGWVVVEPGHLRLARRANEQQEARALVVEVEEQPAANPAEVTVAATAAVA